MKKDAGFSFIQLLIGAGMLSGIFLVSLKVAKNQNQIGKSSSEEFEISYIFDDMRNMLANPKICKATLSLVNAYEGTSLKGIKTLNSFNSFDYEPFYLSGLKFGQKSLKIKSLDYIAGDQESTVDDGEAFVRVVFEKSSSALGKSLVERMMKIHLQVNENSMISSCFALSGLNIKDESTQAPVKIWHDIAGTRNIYTDIKNVRINTQRESAYMGLSLKGKIKVGEDHSSCLDEEAGTIRFQGGNLELCTKKRSWRHIWTKESNLIKEIIVLKSKREQRIKLMDDRFLWCTIAKTDIFGGRCSSTKQNDKKWKLSLEYYRGEASTCIFHCFKKKRI